MATDDTDIGGGLNDERTETELTDTDSANVDLTDENPIDEPEPEIVGGLDENVAGALTYLFGFISGLVFFLAEGDNRFVRFHAVQSMVFSGLIIGMYIAVSVIGTVLTTVMFASSSTFFIGSIVSLLLGLVWLGLAVGGFGLWVYLMVKAYQGATTRLPIAAGIADKLI